MSNPSLGHHAGGEPATERPPVPEPTYAERARTLVHVVIPYARPENTSPERFWTGPAVSYAPTAPPSCPC